VTIESTSPKAFVAGADIAYLGSVQNLALREYMNLGKLVFQKLRSLSKITFSVVNGYCLGGGLELALSTDFILATKSAQFGFPEATLGLIPGFSGFFNAYSRLGLNNFKRLLLTGKIFSFEQSRELGLIDFELEDTEFSTIKEVILANFNLVSPKAVMNAKKVLILCTEFQKAAWDDQENAAFVDCFNCDEAFEGISAFLEKRKPKFVLDHNA
jgi:enoyl-CoA hydratase